MNPALFRHKITFQSPPDPEAVNENGFPIKEWKDFKTAWAMVKTPNDKSSNAEFYEAATTYARNTLTFVTRFTKGIHSDMRIIYNEKVFEIVATPINDNERNKTLTIVAREVV